MPARRGLPGRRSLPGADSPMACLKVKRACKSSCLGSGSDAREVVAARYWKSTRNCARSHDAGWTPRDRTFCHEGRRELNHLFAAVRDHPRSREKSNEKSLSRSHAARSCGPKFKRRKRAVRVSRHKRAVDGIALRIQRHEKPGIAAAILACGDDRGGIESNTENARGRVRVVERRDQNVRMA